MIDVLRSSVTDVSVGHHREMVDAQVGKVGVPQSVDPPQTSLELVRAAVSQFQEQTLWTKVGIS